MSTKDLEAIVFGLQEGKAAVQPPWLAVGVAHYFALPVLTGEEESNVDTGQPDNENKASKQRLNSVIALPMCTRMDLICKQWIAFMLLGCNISSCLHLLIGNT